jgi:transcription initiation factor IIE alpha subunit
LEEKMLTNAEVVERFVLHQEGKGKHLRSDGETLWSYRTPIARWTPIGLVCDVSWFSMTTAIHQSLLWSRCRWNFYPWDDLRGDIPLGELARAEGVAVRRLGHLFFRLAKRRECDLAYIRNSRLLGWLHEKRFLGGLEASALLEYTRRWGWEKRRIGEALLSGDRTKLIAALLLEERMKFDGEKFRFICPHCGAKNNAIEVKTIDIFLCDSFETSEEHIEVDHWPEADPVVLYVCPECGEELDGRDVEEGVERWFKRLRKSRKKYAKWLSENILEVPWNIKSG